MRVYIPGLCRTGSSPFKTRMEESLYSELRLRTAIKTNEKTVKIKLDYSSFAFFSTVHDKWFAENGLFEISVGASSRDIRLKEAVSIELPEEYQPSRNRMDSMIGD